MNWVEAFAAGASNVFSWPGILIPIAGTLLAMITSFLPGIGNTSMVVLVMVFTMGWSPESVLLMFGALTGGATFMGSITAILFNIPGNVSSTPTLLDGYPMAQQGRPRMAIACAATASAVGSLFGVLVLLAALPVVRPLLLEFGPLERLLIGIWGLVTIISVPTSSKLKAAVMTALGLVAAAFGQDPASGVARWTFGNSEMSMGFNVIAMMLGMFTFSELIEWMRTFRLKPSTTGSSQPDDSIREGMLAVFRNFGLTIRSSSIGTLVGMIPGVGGTVAGFVAYGHAVQSTPDSDSFGKGDIRGIIAPEAAVDAKDGGSLLPAVAFGLPGSEAGVALISVFAIHGIVPGMAMLTTQLPLTFTLILALLLSNLLTSVVGVALIPWLARLRNLPIERIALPCLVISLVTVVQVNGLLLDLYTAVGFGIAGYYWRTHGWPRAPFVIAFVLGSLIETNLSLSIQLVDLGRLHPLQRPGCIVLALLIVGSLWWMARQRKSVKRGAERPDADVSIGLLSTAVAGTLLAIALVDRATYSTYVTTVVAVCFVFAMVTTLRAILLQQPHRKAFSRAVLASGLVPAPEHRLPLMLIAGLPVAVWVAGLVEGVGLAVFAWTVVRSTERTARTWLYAVALSALYMLATWWFVNEVANLVLPRGIAWRLFPTT